MDFSKVIIVFSILYDDMFEDYSALTRSLLTIRLSIPS